MFRFSIAKHVISFAIVVSVAAPHLLFGGDLKRPETTPVLPFPTTPPATGAWTVQEAFAGLRFFEPLLVLSTKSDDTLYVLERRGRIYQVHKRREKRLFLDFSANVMRTPDDDDGALAMAFHPEFSDAQSPYRGIFFVGYTANVHGRRYDRLSRFRLQAGKTTVDPKSETVLIDQLDEQRYHNWGSMFFGPDGFLYVGIGDEGATNDIQDAFENSQQIDKDLFSGVLRIDVDCRGNGLSHPPLRQPVTGKTNHYYIPDDNPFVGLPNVLEEFWAIGLRMPHRITLDPATGQIWLGDTGSSIREEINILQRGGNYGWSYFEGSLPHTESYLRGKKPRRYFGHEVKPFFEYNHTYGNGCVIGGYVYRGRRVPDLVGQYVYGDNSSGRIWAMTFTKDRLVSNTEIVDLPYFGKSGLTSFGIDANGEILLCIAGKNGGDNGFILEIVQTKPAQKNLVPNRLSQTGIFSDLNSLTPNPGVIPYDVNSPLWSDGAQKRRWIVLPPNHSRNSGKIVYDPKGHWEYPVGTVFVKHFEIQSDKRDPSKLTRLETRVTVYTDGNGLYGLTYRWNEAQTDANLLTYSVKADIAVFDEHGHKTFRPWTFPGRNDCLTCHNPAAGYVLGVNARQLNRNVLYSPMKIQDNQLRAWSQRGLFTQKLDSRDIDAATRLVSITDKAATLDERMRSYLDVNCAQCHRPGGVVRAKFDARYHTPLAKQKIVHVIAIPGNEAESKIWNRMSSRDAKIHMPPLSTHQVDDVAVGVLSRWIRSLVPWYATAANYVVSLFISSVFLISSYRVTKQDALSTSLGDMYFSVRLLAIFGALWITGMYLLAGLSLFRGSFQGIPLYWWMNAAVVMPCFLILLFHRFRRVVVAVPNSYLIAFHLSRIAALVLVLMADDVRLPAKMAVVGGCELAVGLMAGFLLMYGTIGRVHFAWNVLGLVSGCLMLVYTVVIEPPMLARYPLVTVILILVPTAIVTHVILIYRESALLFQSHTTRRRLALNRVDDRFHRTDGAVNSQSEQQHHHPVFPPTVAEFDSDESFVRGDPPQPPRNQGQQ